MTAFRLTFLVLLLAVGDSVVASEAKVLSLLGGVQLQRHGAAQAARARAELHHGDSLATGQHSAASVLVDDSICYLSDETAIRLDGGSSDSWIEIAAGRVRVVVTQGTALQVRTPDGAIELGPGVYQVNVASQQTELHSIQGRALVMASPPGAGPADIRPVAFPGTRTIGSGECITMPGCEIAPMPAECDAVEQDCVDALQDRAADAAEEEQQEEQPEEMAEEQPEEQPPQEDEPSTTRGDQQSSGQNGSNQNNIAAGSIATSFGGLSASFSSAAGGLFADANQASNEGMIVANPPAGNSIGDPFPGNIHLLTAESRYGIGGINLNADERNDIFASGTNPAYFSIGEGPMPTGQVFTDFLTATDVTPEVVAIPGFNAYVLKFTQFGLPDAGLDPAGAMQNNQGITGLVGNPPTAPTVFGATPTADDRAELNQGATFALGEFRVRPQGADGLELAIRQSDQDRLIVKDGGGNDALDQVTPHPDVQFTDEVDPRFLPAAPTVKVPVAGSFQTNETNFSQLNNLRRAAVTTVLADQLHDFAQRTGQTRFVVDGRVIDISGYQKTP